ncbi:S1 family peptidase [Bdellovibrio bacteriovorus]|uniref:Putative trypsin n=1 Tax=Bdellovibrio bacteriovorus str. Tiberius TaxID=1069642 RepID=K7ZF24_BDEBC|nr:trypsin-like serine protease [Bdellovibrio bacteriovorus]AFY01072.1 putative trypsin [Bdellovibrio bacteriovorus str. Tiberius]
MLNSKLLLSSLLLLSLVACTKNEETNNVEMNGQETSIIGGEKADAANPVTASTVSLIYNYQGKPYSICTGTLISKNLVLTAAHCLVDLQGAEIFVHMGEVLPTTVDETKLLRVAEYETHKDYHLVYDDNGFPVTGRNDVGLIKLLLEAPENAVPVPILDESVELKAGETLLLAGYGLLHEIENPIPATGLNFVRVPLAKLWESILVTDQNNAKGACSGDSGGPAYLETSKGLVVVGITRGPHDLAPDCRHFGEYTNATMFKTFILEEAAAMGADAPVFTTERQ